MKITRSDPLRGPTRLLLRFFLLFCSLQSFSDGVRFYTGGLPEDEIRLSGIFFAMQHRIYHQSIKVQLPLYIYNVPSPVLSSASLFLPPILLLPYRVPTSCSKICDFHRSSPTATSKMYTIKRHRCSWSRGISIESR